MTNKDMDAAFFVGLVLATLFWFFVIIGCTSDADRIGYAYVASEQNGYVVRMDNFNGNATNLTKALSNTEATKVANDINKTLAGRINGPSRTNPNDDSAGRGAAQ